MARSTASLLRRPDAPQRRHSGGSTRSPGPPAAEHHHHHHHHHGGDARTCARARRGSDTPEDRGGRARFCTGVAQPASGR
eukprot:scaffold3836_cov417-Prasinococcus_capsulatus_cf.AAC.7